MRVGQFDKLAHFIGECAEMGIAVLGPDVNGQVKTFLQLKMKSRVVHLFDSVYRQ